MKIKIHRGIGQIGGCITEIATDTTRMLIDLGRNLPKNTEGHNDPLADKTHIEELTKGCQAIFYTHYHGDHVDLFRYVPTGIEQYIGETAKKVMKCKYERLARLPEHTLVTQKDVDKVNALLTFKVLQKIEKGDIRATAFLVSHSACDSYMFLIEADGKKILHTGDFREHGYLGKGLIPTIEKYIVPQNIDVLITEGTMLSRKNETVKSEPELQQEAITLMKNYKYVFVLCSSTDIDRLATFYQASQRTGRSFLCDGYQKEMLDIFTGTSGKKSPLYRFDKAYFYSHGRAEQLKTVKKSGFCMLVRPKHYDMIQELSEILPTGDVLMIYSMWSGYLADGENQNPDYVKLMTLFPADNRRTLHTSGHATPATLAKICRIINPTTAIIPIHSENPKAYNDLDIFEELKKKITLTSTVKDGIDITIYYHG